jgi:hypothetical protein
MRRVVIGLNGRDSNTAPESERKKMRFSVQLCLNGIRSDSLA